MKKSIYLKNSFDSSDAGAGFKIVKTLFSFATLRQCNVTSNGTSNWVRNIFDFFIRLI